MVASIASAICGDSMTLRDGILESLRCPVTGSRLALADAALVGRINELIAANKLQTRISDRVIVPITAGLVNADRTLMYRIDRGILSLLASDAIEIDEVEESA
jgi:uncharacterized protein YbaR (Trm112 family)